MPVIGSPEFSFKVGPVGRPPADVAQTALGGFIDGMLSQYVALDESGVVKIPATLTYEEAATLPSRGVTAWNGLFTPRADTDRRLRVA